MVGLILKGWVHNQQQGPNLNVEFSISTFPFKPLQVQAGPVAAPKIFIWGYSPGVPQWGGGAKPRYKSLGTKFPKS